MSELLEQAANADAGALVTDADADRAILVVDAHRDHRPLEARIADAGHGQQQLAGQEARLSIACKNAPAAAQAAASLETVIRRAYVAGLTYHEEIFP